MTFDHEDIVSHESFDLYIAYKWQELLVTKFRNGVIYFMSKQMYFRFFKERQRRLQWLPRGWKNCLKHGNLQLGKTQVCLPLSFTLIPFSSDKLFLTDQCYITSHIKILRNLFLTMTMKKSYQVLAS